MRKVELGADPAELMQSEGFQTICMKRLHKSESKADRIMLVDAALATSDQDNLHLLTRYRQRMDRWGSREVWVSCLHTTMAYSLMTRCFMYYTSLVETGSNTGPGPGMRFART